jgi:acyl-CoA synthetase (NDP forming)
MAEIAKLMEPMLGALIEHWITKYGKPVLTTTFTEEASRMSESGHFPFPNAERAASALHHLIEYRERLEARDLEDERERS